MNTLKYGYLRLTSEHKVGGQTQINLFVDGFINKKLAQERQRKKLSIIRSAFQKDEFEKLRYGEKIGRKFNICRTT